MKYEKSNLANAAAAAEEPDKKMWPTPTTFFSDQYVEDRESWEAREYNRSKRYEMGGLANAIAADETKKVWPTPTTTPEMPAEGKLRILRQRVLDGDLTHEDARAMLSGRSPFEAWGHAPKAKDGPHGHKGLQAYTGPWPEHLKHLDDERSMWPTPVASDSAGSRRETARKDHWKSNEGETLTDAAWKQDDRWRTPTAREYKGASPASWTERDPKDGDPIPTLTDQVNSRQGRTPGRLNADWVEWLMGWPIGWTSLDPMDPAVFEEWFTTIWRGPWWLKEPSSVPRITKGQVNQGARLKACGNGQVALCAAGAALALLETVWQVDEFLRLSEEPADFLSLIGL
jgi:hypothetical protein